MTWLQSLPLPAIGAIVFVALMAALEAGYRGARWMIRRRMDEAAPADPERRLGAGQDHLLTAVLGLLALLLGFTFSLALNRFEARRDLVVKEANALGSTWLGAQLLHDPGKTELSALLRDYVDVRLRWSETYAGRDDMAPTHGLQQSLWTATAAAVRAEPSEAVRSRLIRSMGESFDIAAARLAGRSAHIPARVMNVLLLYVLLAVVMLGQVSAARDGLHRISTGLLLLLLTLALLVILDLDRTADGAILVSQQPLIDLGASIR